MSFSPEVWREGLAPALVLGGVAGASFVLYLLGGEKVSSWLEKRGKKKPKAGKAEISGSDETL